jgi:hypothetical protein
VSKEFAENVESRDAGPQQADELQSRRQFLTGLGKWSKIVITVALLGSGASAEIADAAVELHRRGGGRGWPRGGYPVGPGPWTNNEWTNNECIWMNNECGWFNNECSWINNECAFDDDD